MTRGASAANRTGVATGTRIGSCHADPCQYRVHDLPISCPSISPIPPRDIDMAMSTPRTPYGAKRRRRRSPYGIHVRKARIRTRRAPGKKTQSRAAVRLEQTIRSMTGGHPLRNLAQHYDRPGSHSHIFYLQEKPGRLSFVRIPRENNLGTKPCRLHLHHASASRDPGHSCQQPCSDGVSRVAFLSG